MFQDNLFSFNIPGVFMYVIPEQYLEIAGKVNPVTLSIAHNSLRDAGPN